MPSTKRDIIIQLQQEILRLQGFKPPAAGFAIDFGLGAINDAFTNRIFPTGTLHELISPRPENAAATSGFIAGLIAPLMAAGGVCVWVSCARKIYPPGLKAFGIEPDQVVFMDMRDDREVLWTTEEALKCEGLAAVVGEMQEITFTASRRFQLAAEHSRVTAFLLRHKPRNLNPIAAVARWHITHLPSDLGLHMPGLGFPRWNVELSRVRNGQPGVWQLEWQAGQFLTSVPQVQLQPEEQKRQTG